MRDAPPDDVQMLDGSQDIEETITTISGHGINIDNAAACCRIASGKGLVDCAACLHDAKVTTLDFFDPAARHVAEKILEIVDRAGRVGVAKKDISVSLVYCI